MLLGPRDKILLALSGGIDSIVLFDLLVHCGFSISVAHCNFKLRGKESDADEVFVRSLCKKYAIPCFVKSFETEAYATKNKISIQMAARELRYKWFNELRENKGLDCICTAHHKSDVVETMLINLIRGTGISGLHGIQAKHGFIVRPLLFAKKNDILNYAQKHKLKFREDSSNASDDYLRNKIRHHVIPELVKVDPDFERGFFDTANHIQKSESLLNLLINNELKKIRKINGEIQSFQISNLLKIREPENFLYEILKDYHFSSAQCSMLYKALNKGSGKQFNSVTHRLLIDRNFLVLSPLKNSVQKDSFRINKLSDFKKLPIHLDASKSKINDQFELNKKRTIAQIDAQSVSFPFELRRWKKGDSFYPLGMNKRKKLSDFFIDHKLSIFDKEEVWLLCSNGEIIWVINYRIDERYKITSRTKEYFQFEFTN